MAVYFITGKLGGGKTLVSVGKIKDYLDRGRPVATNLDLKLEFLISRQNKDAKVYRLPDKPLASDMDEIGYANHSPDEKMNGLLVLDELGTWLNSRTFSSDKDRQPFIDWLLHARKLGWDVLLIVQNVDLVDKQVRIALGEYIVTCRRTDRIPLPVIGFLFRIIGLPIKVPRAHIGIVRYGDIFAETWVYRGNSLFKAYDTKQIFMKNDDRTAQYIPPFFLNQKRFAKRNKEFFMRLTKIYWKKYERIAIFGAAVLFNFVVIVLFAFYTSQPTDAVVQKEVTAQTSKSNGSKVQTSKVDKETEQKTVLTRIPYLVETGPDKKSKVLLVYQKNMFTPKTFPYPVQWINNEPFFYAPVEDDDTQG